MKNSNSKFNLVKYVYGRCYEAFLVNKPLVEIKNKIYQWRNIFKWLEREKYISNLKFNFQDKNCLVTYDFNNNKVMYEYYLKGIERNINIIKNNADLSFVPMGEIVNNEPVSELEQERLNTFKKAVEYISEDDRIRRTRTDEEIYEAC